MKILFIHQNFPGQYLHLAGYIQRMGRHEITGLGEEKNIRRRGTLPGIATVGYPTPQGPGPQTHHYLQSTEAAVRRGQVVARALLDLKGKGFVPDAISLHPGWGEGLFVRDVFPDAPILMFCEYYFRADQADLGFDPEFPQTPDWSFSVRIRNTSQIMSLITANARLCPTHWQASRYPAFVREGIHTIHDGVHTEFMRPDPEETLTIQPMDQTGESRVFGSESGPDDEAAPEAAKEKRPRLRPKGEPLTLSRRDKVVTYVARNLEPYRGLHVFLRSLPALQRLHPDAHVLIAGSDGSSYSPPLPEGMTYKRKYLDELEGKLDLSRIHFLGRVPYTALRSMFRISSAHVYLTYPFVLSWSVLEAMACETLVVASSTPPVMEVITHNENGLLVDFFDSAELVGTLDSALREPEQFAHLRKNARRLVEERFELNKCLRQQFALLENLARGRYPNPS